MKRIHEWLSVKAVKSPRLIVLLGVLFANAAFICAAAAVISWLTPPELEGGGFGNSIFNTIIMYLGIGGIDTVIEEVGQADALLVLASIIIVLIGLVFFTYALIGYMSELISNFIGNADSGTKRLRISNHTVILNWNTRAVEIINDLLYRNTKEKIVVLAENDKDDVRRDIHERLADTIASESEAVQSAAAQMGAFERRRYMQRNKMRNRLVIITREGNTCSAKQLGDIAVGQAKSVIILSAGDNEASVNSHTVKTLIQVAQMTTSKDVASEATIVVEVEDDQTLALLNKIIQYKKRSGICSIIPVPVNRILGYVFSQFTIMPELNRVYSTLFSYKDADLFAWLVEDASLSDMTFISNFLTEHLKAIPLTIMEEDGGKRRGYFLAENERDIRSIEPASWKHEKRISLNEDFEIDERHIVVLGHNSKNAAMMEGFAAFNREWQKRDGTEALDITMIDDEPSLLKQNYYRQYSWVKKVFSAEMDEQDTICNAISEFLDKHGKGGCILILSDDTVSGEEADENALTYLVLVQDIISSRLEHDPNFDLNDMEIIVEIVDPQNHDIVQHYNMKNVVISNRYVSKMILQVGENRALYDFYLDFLTYDGLDAAGADSKELYIKRVDRFFAETPKPCTAAELIRAVYHASPADNKSILMGYFHPDGEMVLFSGNQADINVAFTGQEKLILFSNH